MTTLRLRKRWKGANDDALFGAVGPYRMAAFWKEATMAKSKGLHLLGFGRPGRHWLETNLRFFGNKSYINL